MGVVLEVANVSYGKGCDGFDPVLEGAVEQGWLWLAVNVDARVGSLNHGERERPTGL